MVSVKSVGQCTGPIFCLYGLKQKQMSKIWKKTFEVLFTFFTADFVDNWRFKTLNTGSNGRNILLVLQ